MLKQLVCQTELSRRAQNLTALSQLISHYNDLRGVREQVFKGDKITFSEFTSLCNSLDEIGTFIYRLPPQDQNPLIEQWIETFIRCWTKLKNSIDKKRANSLGRDYAYFEWLANKSFELHKDFYPKFKIHAYKYEDIKFEPLEADFPISISEEDLIEKHKKDFIGSEEVKKSYLV